MTGPRFDWRYRVDAAVAASEAARTPPVGQRKLLTTFRSSANDLILAAAARRDVSTATFIRRSTLAFTAVVLEMDYGLVIEADPTFQRGHGYASAYDPSGLLGGPWEIRALT